MLSGPNNVFSGRRSGFKSMLRAFLLGSTLIPSWVLLGSQAAAAGIVADYDFVNDRYYGPALSCTRAGSAAVIGRDGLWQQVAANTPRRGYYPDPNGIERRNYIRNNTMQGALAADGVELVAGGDFATNPTANGWSFGATGGTSVASYDAAGQRLSLLADGSNTCFAEKPIPTVVGRIYTVALDVANLTCTLSIGAAQGSASIMNVGPALGRNYYQFTATSTTTWVRLSKTAAGQAYIDNVSVQWAGALPTNWSIGQLSTLLTEVRASGVDAIGSYGDVRIFGTGSTTAAIYAEAHTQVAARSGQVWSISGGVPLVGGSLTNVTGASLSLRQSDGAGANIGFITGTTFFPPAATARQASSLTLANASTAFTTPAVLVTTTGAVDLTLRIYDLALELSPYATLPVIKTSGAAASVVSGDPTWNKIRNSVGAGADGTSTLPTNWTLSTANGISRQFTQATINGVQGTLVRVFATNPTATSSQSIDVESTVGVPAANGQTWTYSTVCDLYAGTLTNVSGFSSNLVQRDSGGAALAGVGQTLFTPGSAQARISVTGTANNAATAFMLPRLSFNYTAGQPFDLTLFIALPQLERSPVATTALANAPGIYTAPAGTPTGNLIRFSDCNTATGNGIGANTTRVGAQADPFGGNLASSYTSAATASSFVNNGGPIALPAGTYCLSVYAKRVSGTGTIGTLLAAAPNDAGAVPRTTIPMSALPADSVWRRYSVTFTTTDVTAFVAYMFADTGAVGEVALYGVQVEPGDRPGPLVRTTGTPVLNGYSGPVPAGLLVETAGTNSIRNNSMQGAVAGSPGTLPTNWGGFGVAGTTWQVIGAGIEGGIDYVDLRLSGTATAAGSSEVAFDTSTAIAAATGQTWICSTFLKLVGGSLANATVLLAPGEYTSAGVFVAGGSDVAVPQPTASALGLQRVNAQRTLSGGATVGAVVCPLRVRVAAPGAVDLTIRIGWPQLEQSTAGAPSSPIRTTGTAVTRAADVVTASVTLPPANVELVPEGAFTVDPTTRGWTFGKAGGTSLASWDSAGQRLSLLGDGTNACFAEKSFPTIVGQRYTLQFDNTPGFSTANVNIGSTQGGSDLYNFSSVLGANTITVTATTATTWLRLNKTGATQVYIDNVSVQGPGSAVTVVAQGTPLTAPGNPLNQVLAGISDNTAANNRALVYRLGGNGVPRITMSHDAAFVSNSTVAWPIGTSLKTAFTESIGDSAFVVSGGAPEKSATSSTFPAVTALYIGCRGDGALQWSGYVERVGLFASRANDNTLATVLTAAA